MLARMITNHPKLILLLALLLAVPAAYQALHTPINYDIFSYIPAEIESIRGQKILKEEFRSADTAYLLLREVETPQVLKLQRGLEELDGVSHVAWLNDLADPTTPAAFLPPEILSLYKRGNNALLHVSFSLPAADLQTLDSVGLVKEYLNSQSIRPIFTGLPVFIAELRQLINEQKTKSILAAVIISWLLMTIAMRSFSLPIIFLSTIGLGVIYNLGTNFGSISYVTESMAAVIQLGVTFDFSIFLTHRFREELQICKSPQEAMRKTLHLTTRAILPAALTTMAGFMALSLMTVRVGADMGFIMAKGVFMGLLTSLSVLPAALLLTKVKIRDIDAVMLAHKGMARFIVRHPLILSLLFLLAFVPAGYGRFNTSLSYSVDDSLPEDMDSIQAIDEIKEVMGSIDLIQVLLPTSLERHERQTLIQQLENLESIAQAFALEKLVDPAIPESFIPPAVKDRFERGGYSMATLKLVPVGGTPEANDAVEEVRRTIRAAGIDGFYVSGVPAISNDLSRLSARDIPRVNLASILFIMLIIMLVSRSLSIPVLLIAGIQLAIFINLSIAWLFGTTLPFLTFTSISAIQLGATVDYAILLMTRYREERQSQNPEEAMLRAITTASPAIFLSGMCLFAATIGLTFVNDVKMIQSMALLIARGAVISVIVIIGLLPAVILKCDRLIGWTTLGWKR